LLDRSAFLFQPEALMIFDLLKKEPLSVRESWVEHYPPKELERIALAFGVTFDRSFHPRTYRCNLRETYRR
jgi:hypothetical protein